jgi:hypothetical protein
MKKTIFLPVFGLLLLAVSCSRDPHILDLERFDVRWLDEDQSNTQTPADILQFSIQINTTARDPDDQFITEWEFSYYVNDQFGDVLQGDSGIRSNSVVFDADVTVKNLWLPFPGGLLPGDVVEFYLFALDNHGERVEQRYRYVLE